MQHPFDSPPPAPGTVPLRQPRPSSAVFRCVAAAPPAVARRPSVRFAVRGSASGSRCSSGCSSSRGSSCASPRVRPVVRKPACRLTLRGPLALTSTPVRPGVRSVVRPGVRSLVRPAVRARGQRSATSPLAACRCGARVALTSIWSSPHPTLDALRRLNWPSGPAGPSRLPASSSSAVFRLRARRSLRSRPDPQDPSC